MIKELLTIVVVSTLSMVTVASEHLKDSSTETKKEADSGSGESFMNWIKKNSTPVLPLGFDGGGGNGNDGGNGGGGSGGGGGGDGGGAGGHG